MRSRSKRLYMIIRRSIEPRGFYVDVRLGCNMPKGFVGDGVRSFYRKKLPYRIEHYPTLSTYWKIRLMFKEQQS